MHFICQRKHPVGNLLRNDMPAKKILSDCSIIQMYKVLYNMCVYTAVII